MRNFYLFFIALLITGATACKDAIDDSSWDISPDSKLQVIEKEINGIAFKFCLLNEQGKPATIFNEGENFSFYFSVSNDSKKNYYYVGYAIAYDKNFLRVFNSSGYDFGKSYSPLPIPEVGIAAWPFNAGAVHIIKVPWLHEKDSVLCAENFCYESIIQKPLVKGIYYTGFKYSFYFQGQNESDTFRTDSINFKINFKIQ